MADLQLLEVVSEWSAFWESPTTFQPIGELPDVGAALHNIHPSYLAKATLKDWVDVFAADDGADIRNTVDWVCQSYDSNRKLFQQGRMTKEVLKRMDRKHVAIQLARSEHDGDAAEALRRSEEILAQQPVGAQIEFFVDFGGMVNLKSYQVESALAANLWASSAKLNSRYIDRQHASVGLPYCDRFVTDDSDLIKRCEAAKRSLAFPTAQVQRAKEFIESL